MSITKDEEFNPIFNLIYKDEYVELLNDEGNCFCHCGFGKCNLVFKRAYFESCTFVDSIIICETDDDVEHDSIQVAFERCIFDNCRIYIKSNSYFSSIITDYGCEYSSDTDIEIEGKFRSDTFPIEKNYADKIKILEKNKKLLNAFTELAVKQVGGKPNNDAELDIFIGHIGTTDPGLFESVIKSVEGEEE